MTIDLEFGQRMMVLVLMLVLLVSFLRILLPLLLLKDSVDLSLHLLRNLFMLSIVGFWNFGQKLFQKSRLMLDSKEEALMQQIS